MINITHKNTTLRTAVAQAIVRLSAQATVAAVLEKRVPKGDVLEMAKTAGLFAAKRTADMIPDCHPLPIEFTAVRYEIKDLDIRIEVEVHTVYKTGVEVEAMHAASVVALTIYDMLKPIDKGISIEQIKLLEKKGGKSETAKKDFGLIKAAVIVCSDSISKGLKQDKAGKAIIEKLNNVKVEVADYIVVPDEYQVIQTKVKNYAEQGLQLVILTGGTGLSPRDITPEALKPLLDRTIPGIEEAIRAYGQARTPYAMLSRSVVGLLGQTLVLALPGSTKGASESMDAVFPAILHIFGVIQGERHD